MFVGVVVSIFLGASGIEVGADAMLFETQKECVELSQTVEASGKANPETLAYKIDCFDVQKSFVLKKKGDAPPKTVVKPQT